MTTIERILDGSDAVALVGLGYVGLPLAVALGEKVRVIGFDVSERRVAELSGGVDSTGEVTSAELAGTSVEYTTDPARLAEAAFFIITVPTPITRDHRPDLGAVRSASATVGRFIRPGSIVVLESTVYPGVTEEVVAPVIERESGLKCGVDFKVGYSPERINPGDRVHTVRTVVKIVAGMDAETLDTVAALYSLVVEPGVHRAPSIMVAEAAKVIENTQRDVNIALMNECSAIFDRLGISTGDVLRAAGTKWNFLNFTPGLVGGHCTGVDPYYLVHRAKEVGVDAALIRAARQVNEEVGPRVAQAAVRLLEKADRRVEGAKVLILGISFKEDVCDIRNTKVAEVVSGLADLGAELTICDPLADEHGARQELGIILTPLEDAQKVDAVVLAVPHSIWGEFTAERLKSLFREGQDGIVIDVRGACDRFEIQRNGILYWSLH